ncbi:MAG TPA: hypothetical protein VK449_08545, partial [Anaerolineales bacterium]|nr:hypothetical protein [Anaerolineales bacterium]
AQAKIALLIGSDSLADLPRWHEPGRLIDLCAVIGVMDRPGHVPELAALERAVPGLAAKVRRFAVPQIEISARDIRHRVAHGQSIRYLVPEAVRDLIELEGLYREAGPA